MLQVWGDHAQPVATTGSKDSAKLLLVYVTRAENREAVLGGPAVADCAGVEPVIIVYGRAISQVPGLTAHLCIWTADFGRH